MGFDKQTLIIFFCNKDKIRLLWSSGSMHSCHAADPCSIPGLDKFPG